jgi:uncharacterized protein YciI
VYGSFILIPPERGENCQVLSERKCDLLAPLGGAPEIGGSPMYVHATGIIPDVEKLAPHWDEETRVLTELHAEGVVKNLFRFNDRQVYVIIEADDVEDARRQIGRLPFVSNGLLLFKFEPVEKLI